MPENLVKRQHFVPRTYLKHFGKTEGQEHFIHALPNQATEKEKIFKSNIKNIALEKHLYTLPGQTVQQKMAVEKFYSEELEQHYDSIYNLLTDSKQIELSADERELVISTVVTMFYRTTMWVNANRNLMSRTFELAFYRCQQHGKDFFYFGEEKMTIAGKTLEEFTKEYNKKNQSTMILTQLETALKLINLRLQTDSICVIKLENEKLELVTSDNPVIAYHPEKERTIPFDPNNILKLPLDSKHILMLIPEKERGFENRIFRTVTKGSIASIEKLTSDFSQMQSSETFMFGSKSALESYLITKDESERPVKEGEKTTEIFAKLIELGL